MNRKILFVENNKSYRLAITKLLAYQGFLVTGASSLAEAEERLEQETFHAALCDIRTRDDDDRLDISGLNFVQDEKYSALPKIVLTGYPSIEYMRQAMTPKPNGVQPAVRFLSKDEGPKKLIQALEKVMASHVQANWDLDIHSDHEAVGFVLLASLIFPQSSPAMQLKRAEELDFLFRQLFPKATQIRLGFLLWCRNDCVALPVFVFEKNKSFDSFLVTCGRVLPIRLEARRFETHAPKSPGKGIASLVTKVETLHVAGNVFTLPLWDIAHTHGLKTAFGENSSNAFGAILTNLIEGPLDAWHQQKKFLRKEFSLGDWLWERLFAGISGEMFEEVLAKLITQATRLDLVIRRQAESIVFRFKGQDHVFSDPLAYLAEGDPEMPLVLMNSPGTLSGENILVNDQGESWLTDYHAAGYAPDVWNFVSLEAEIRFEFTHSQNISWLYRFETLLTGPDFLLENAMPEDEAMAKPLEAIRTIRRLTGSRVWDDPRGYHLGMYYHAMKRLASHPPDLGLLPHELARLLHLLMAAGMSCQAVKGSGAKPVSSPRTQKAKGLVIDAKNRAVWCDGERVKLRGKNYQILLYLYERAGNLCTRQELGELVYGRFDETNHQDNIKLNTAISRLRDRIENDPKNPRFLHTETGIGYVLYPDAEGHQLV